MNCCLLQVRKDLVTAVRRNRERAKTATAYTEMMEENSGAKTNPMDSIIGQTYGEKF